jgi:hypothetical protein
VQTIIAEPRTSFPIQVIELELLNDAWDQPTGRDRNVAITDINVSGTGQIEILKKIPTGSEDAVALSGKRIRILRNGTLRLEINVTGLSTGQPALQER